MNDRVLTIENMARKLKPVFGKKIDDLYLRYSMAQDRDEQNEVAHVINALYSKRLGHLLDRNVLLEPPEKQMVEGNHNLGIVSYADKSLYPFNLRDQDFPRHVCITGMSGSGKTTFAFKILQNFMEQQKPFFVFDWKKSFRPLMAQDSNVMTFTIGNDKVSNVFKTNINRPPKGVSPKEWIGTLTDLLAESFCVSFGVHKILVEALDFLFKGWEVYEKGENYPTWHHVKKYLEEKLEDSNGREATWIESALRIASVLTFGDFGKVVNYEGKKAVMVEDLFNKQVIFELNSLGNIEKKFFCEFLLTYVYRLKKARQNTCENVFDHAILVDEAHNIFLKDKTHFVRESVTDMVYREMREYGTSLICLDQHISKISDTVKGNSACHIAFQQQLPEDILDISRLMQLEDHKDYFSKLQIGNAIVKLAERYSSPFLIEVPFIDTRKDVVGDDLVKERMKHLMEVLSFEKRTDPDFHNSLVYGGKVKSKTQDVFVVPNFLSKDIPRFSKVNFNQEFSKDKSIKVQEKVVEKINPDLSELSPRQKVLYDFLLERVALGEDLFEIQEIIQSGLCEGLYTDSDIMIIFNCYLKNKMSEKIVSNNSKEVTLPDFKFESSRIEGLEDSFQVEEKEDFELEFPSFGLNPSNVKITSKTRPEKVISEVVEPVEKNVGIETPKFDEVVSEVTMNVSSDFVEDSVQRDTITDEDMKKPSQSGRIVPVGGWEKMKKEIAWSLNLSDRPSIYDKKAVLEKMDKVIDDSKVESKNESVVTEERKHLKSNITTPNQFKNLSLDQRKFIEFLMNNPDHTLSTVDVYKTVGLSPRKGNNVKNELIEKNLVQVFEEKSDKGWKKYIRLSQ